MTIHDVKFDIEKEKDYYVVRNNLNILYIIYFNITEMYMVYTYTIYCIYVYIYNSTYRK